jgi:multisubunit Na+/H+ antiporter MnhB subunit
MIREIVLSLCLAVLFASLFAVVAAPLFSNWNNKDVARYYLDDGFRETGSSNIVSAIVWDLRGFDTMGEETVLFTAAAGISAVVILGFIGRKR